MRLEKKQWNELFEMIVAGGLDPRECIPINSDARSFIEHKPSQSYISVTPPESSITPWVVRMKVSDGNVRTRSGRYWDTVRVCTKEWAEEVMIPDFWADFANSSRTFSGSQYINMANTLFTPTEQAEIAKQLRGIANYVEKTYSLSREQMKVLRERFEEAEAASKRIGRKDWLLLFSGTLLTL